MNDSQLLSLFVGIIMVCMVIIATALVFLTVKHINALHKATAFIAFSQNELSGLCHKAIFMLDDVSELITVVEEKSHLLALKASGSIANLTLATTVLKTFSQLWNKNSNPEGDTMKHKPLLGFALGATITGVGAYYIYKNKDELSDKIEDLEETLCKFHSHVSSHFTFMFPPVSQTCFHLFHSKVPLGNGTVKWIGIFL